MLSGQKFIKIAKSGQFGEFLNATFWEIFKQCDIARFYVVRYGFLCRTKNDLWVWQKVSQLRVTRLIFHYVLTFCLFFLAYLPTDRKEVFFQSLTWQASRPYKISHKIGKLIKYTLSNPLCIWCNAIVFWISYSFHYFSYQYVRVQGVQISLLHSKTLNTL